MEEPLVSIITPLYNSELFLRETIDSVLNQTYINWEWQIVDDCSSDKSVEIIEAYALSDARFNLIKFDENKGSGPARNEAIKNANGEILAFLDSDDIWHKDKLSIHVRFMIDKNAVFSHTSYGFIDEEGNKINNTYNVSDNPIGYVDLLKRTEISCLTAMYNCNIIGKIYMPDIRRKQDYALWLSILKEGYKSIPLNEELAYYRQRKGSATNNKFKLIFKHYLFLRKIESLNVFKSLYYTFSWGLNGISKYYLSKLF